MTQDPADSWLFAACADLGRDLWGLILGGIEPRAVVRTIGSAGTGSAAGVSAEEPGAAPAVQLSPAGEAAGHLAVTEGIGDAIAPLRATGAPAADVELDAPAFGFAGPKLSKLDSVRILAAWFPSESAVAVAAVRPRGGHADKDVVTVLVTGEPEPLRVFDPRLSTTYDAGGSPLRAGLELWLGADEEGDQRLLRLACESTGDRLGAELGGLQLEAYPQRCHSHGEDGAGVYVLLRPR